MARTPSILAALGAALLFAVACAAPPGGPRLEAVGEAAEVSLDVPMPPGTRLFHTELPYAGSSDQRYVLLTPLGPSEAADWFRERGAEETRPLAFAIGEEVTLEIEAPEQIPTSGYGHLLVQSMPTDAGAMVVVHRHGTPGPCPPCPEGYVGTTVENCRCP